jgi:hypothetical protein
MKVEELNFARVMRDTRIGYGTDDHQSSKTRTFSANFFPSYVYPSNAVHGIAEHTDVRPKGRMDFFTMRVI